MIVSGRHRAWNMPLIQEQQDRALNSYAALVRVLLEMGATAEESRAVQQDLARPLEPIRHILGLPRQGTAHPVTNCAETGRSVLLEKRLSAGIRKKWHSTRLSRFSEKRRI